MKKAFTLIELIFVIILIGVLGGLGISSLKVDYANKDGQFLLLKIKEARYKAMGYEGDDKDGACIVLTKTAIQKDENRTTSPYKIRSDIIRPSLLSKKPLCFDALGKPHKGTAYDGEKLKLNNLLHQNIDINVKYSGKNCQIRVHSFSGYAIIACS